MEELGGMKITSGQSKVISNPIARYYQAMKQLKDSIDDCLTRGRVLSCLTLLYSAIDVLASLEKRTGEGTRQAFIRWVNKYMLPNDDFRFTGIDLYAARCGIVHSFSCDSDLSRQGKAKKIMYAWGNASAGTLDDAARALGRSEISVHLRSLVDGFGNAMVKYIEDVVSDRERHARFLNTVGHWLVGVESTAFDQLLAAQKAGLASSQSRMPE